MPMDFIKVNPKLRLSIGRDKKRVSIPSCFTGHWYSGRRRKEGNRDLELQNFATDERSAFSKGVKAYLKENPDTYDPKRNMGQPAERL